MIDLEEDLPINLYHGTSSIFLPWIERYGLGGFEILKEFKLQKIFEELCTVLEENGEKSEWWERNQICVEPMIDGAVIPGGMDFRYSEVYASASRRTAEGYATGNKYGSEYVSMLFGAYEAVKEISVELADKIFPQNHAMHELIGTRNEPILITIKNLKRNELATDNDREIVEQLEEIRIHDESELDLCNFRISKIVPYEELVVEYLGTEEGDFY